MRDHTRTALQQLQATYDRVARGYRDLIAVSREAEGHPFDDCPPHLRPFQYGVFDLTNALTKIGRRTAAQAVELIRDELATGRELDLPGSDVIVSQFLGEPQGETPSESFSCVELGQALYDAYAGQAEVMARQQAANRVVEHFGLSAGEEPRTRGGFVVLSIRMYTDTWGGRHTYTNDRALFEACQSLTDVLACIEPAIVGSMQMGMRRLAEVGGMNCWAPERHAYGPIGPVELRAYQSKVEFLVPAALAVRINGFLTEHASRFARAARRCA